MADPYELAYSRQVSEPDFIREARRRGCKARQLSFAEDVKHNDFELQMPGWPKPRRGDVKTVWPIHDYGFLSYLSLSVQFVEDMRKDNAPKDHLTVGSFTAEGEGRRKGAAIYVFFKTQDIVWDSRLMLKTNSSNGKQYWRTPTVKALMKSYEHRVWEVQKC